MSKKELRVGDKIIVIDDAHQLRFYFANDPQKLLYQFDDEGNALYCGEAQS